MDEIDKFREEELVIRQVMLIPGSWKSFLTEYEYKMMVAGALNHCVAVDGLIIRGYLITMEKTYIVVQIYKYELRKILLLFFAAITGSLLTHFSALAKKGVPFLPPIEIFEAGPMGTALFEDYLFEDEMLVQLLTNEVKDLPLYDPEFEKMKAWLKSSDFCSYPKHAQQVGPVLMNQPMLKKKRRYE